MARQARIVVPGIVHHVVARGVNKTPIFNSGYDKGRYLKRVARIADEEKVQVHGYCLLNNHVHFVLTPTTANGLAHFFKRLHTWWAMFFNGKYGRTGHLFQCRYHSSPLSETHYWNALRYVELNAVRAKLVRRPEDWLWSSARTHLRLSRRAIVPLTSVLSRATTNPTEWRQILECVSREADEQLRAAHRTSRPCGPLEFVKDLQERYRHPATKSAECTAPHS